jgi:nitroreductase
MGSALSVKRILARMPLRRILFVTGVLTVKRQTISGSEGEVRFLLGVISWGWYLIPAPFFFNYFPLSLKCMTVFEAIKKRYSCRNYKSEPVSEDKLDVLLEAARLAPSAHNAQDWKLVVIKDAEKRKALSEAAGQSFIAEAPVIITAVGLKPGYVMPCGTPAYVVDLAIAIDHMTLVATELGLGTCWIGAFSEGKVRKVLNIPKECKVVVLLPVGYPDDKPSPKSRKELEEIISEDSF